MFPFNDYKVIPFGPIASESGAVIHTTTATSLIYFIPYGPYMEDDTPIEVYVSSYFVDSDGGSASMWIYRSHASGSSTLYLNYGYDEILKTGTNVGVMVPAGKNIIARVGDNSDKIGGTLYVLELPN